MLRLAKSLIERGHRIDLLLLRLSGHALCINVPRAADLRAAMIEQFRRLGMAFEIFPATDWRNLDEADFALVDAEARWRAGVAQPDL